MTALASPELGAAHDVAGHGLHARLSPHLSLLPQTNSHSLQTCTPPWHKSGDKRKWKEEICQQKTKKTEAIDLISLFSPNSHTVSVWLPSGLIYPDAQFQDITGGGKCRFFHMSKALWGLPWWTITQVMGSFQFQPRSGAGHTPQWAFDKPPDGRGRCSAPHVWTSSARTLRLCLPHSSPHLVMLDWWAAGKESQPFGLLSGPPTPAPGDPAFWAMISFHKSTCSTSRCFMIFSVACQ